jgi:hypothetical protein
MPFPTELTTPPVTKMYFGIYKKSGTFRGRRPTIILARR